MVPGMHCSSRVMEPRCTVSDSAFERRNAIQRSFTLAAPATDGPGVRGIAGVPKLQTPANWPLRPRPIRS